MNFILFNCSVYIVHQREREKKRERERAEKKKEGEKVEEKVKIGRDKNSEGHVENESISQPTRHTRISDIAYALKRNICMYTVCMQLYAYMYICIHACMYMYVCMYVCIYIYVLVYSTVCK